MKTPITVVTGFLGSGKTTLLLHILDHVPKKIAILMNEFGEIGIDSKVIEGKNVRMAELAGGCVCCSLVGEFEAAINEIIDAADPEWIAVEATGVAEPDALVFDIQENLSRVRLDGVVTVADADSLVKYPQLGRTARLQIEAADLLLLNKTDLVSSRELRQAEEKLRRLNPQAAILRTLRCRVDADLLFGLGRERDFLSPRHTHQPEFDSFDYASPAALERRLFEEFAATLHGKIYRAKGFVRFSDGSYLFNFVAGRWELEPFPAERTALVFIGNRPLKHMQEILDVLLRCER